MAAGNQHAGSETEFHRLDQAKPLELLNDGAHPGVQKNMREVRISPGRNLRTEMHALFFFLLFLFCFINILFPCQFAYWTCDDMANKENELTCAEDAQSIHYNDNCGFPVNSAESSKMAGAASKYSDYFSELSKDHDAMTHVLFGRNLRLNVALTLWRRNASELVAYLIRIQDTGVLLDCLPILAKSLQDEQPYVSVGCCIDLLPQVKSVLASKYEEHLIVALHWVRSVIKKWWPELSANDKRAQNDGPNDGNIVVMKQQLKELWEEGGQLSLVPGTTGEIAKVIESYLSQLK
uniref:Katanin p80 subunit C-terminal domain-containing protein n=1 Tax=Denticeps clupeoides TaxID=299321 RepID=A0AAY4BS37_9TELE